MWTQRFCKGRFVSILLWLVLSGWSMAHAQTTPALEAEASKFRRTGSYAEVEQLCQTLAKEPVLISSIHLPSEV